MAMRANAHRRLFHPGHSWLGCLFPWRLSFSCGREADGVAVDFSSMPNCDDETLRRNRLLSPSNRFVDIYVSLASCVRIRMPMQ